MKKLYVVEVKHIGVVLADDEDEAQSFAQEIVENEFDPDIDVDVMKVTPWGWDDDTLVFHGGLDDITVKEAIEMTKEDE